MHPELQPTSSLNRIKPCRNRRSALRNDRNWPLPDRQLLDVENVEADVHLRSSTVGRPSSSDLALHGFAARGNEAPHLGNANSHRRRLLIGLSAWLVHAATTINSIRRGSDGPECRICYASCKLTRRKLDSASASPA